MGMHRDGVMTEESSEVRVDAAVASNLASAPFAQWREQVRRNYYDKKGAPGIRHFGETPAAALARGYGTWAPSKLTASSSPKLTKRPSKKWMHSIKRT